MNWRIVVAVVVAFVLGVGAGGLVEHQRLKNKSNAKSAKSATSTKGKTINWFGPNSSSVCPTLAQWKAANTATYVALVTKAAWPQTQAQLTKESSAVIAAYHALLPKATANGKVQLNLLLAHQNQLAAAIKRATSTTSYLAAQKAATSKRVRGVNTLLSRQQARCATT